MSLRSILTTLVVVVIFYFLYLIIGMSSTYSTISQYYFNVAPSEIGEAIIGKIDLVEGWSYELSDTISTENDGTQVWIDLYYNTDIQRLKYSLKYGAYGESEVCSEVHLVGAFDILNKSGGYKITADGVDRLVIIVEESILQELAPICTQ